jgi:hypothetical protein
MLPAFQSRRYAVYALVIFSQFLIFRLNAPAVARQCFLLIGLRHAFQVIY